MEAERVGVAVPVVCRGRGRQRERGCRDERQKQSFHVDTSPLVFTHVVPAGAGFVRSGRKSPVKRWVKFSGNAAESESEVLAPDPRLARIDVMDGLEFEAQVAELLDLLGWLDIERTGRFDKGADIIGLRDNVRTAVQAKRRATAVTVDAIRQLVDGMRHYRCDAGVLVTNSYLTPPAAASAKEWRIEVWDRPVIAGFADGDEPRLDLTTCATCGRSVTAGVAQYCLGQPHRFGGHVYCMEHQNRARRSESPS